MKKREGDTLDRYSVGFPIINLFGNAKFFELIVDVVIIVAVLVVSIVFTRVRQSN